MVYDGEDIGPLRYPDGQEIREGDYVFNVSTEDYAIVEYVDIGVEEVHLLYKHRTGCADPLNLALQGRAKDA
jgi:hypothetical protein